MFNINQFEGKTIRNFDYRLNSDQMIIYFTDNSFLIINTQVPKPRGFDSSPELCFTGKPFENHLTCE